MAATPPSPPNRRSRPATTPVAAPSSKQAAVADRHPAREESMATELRVDADRTGHGRCYSAAPNLLSDDEEGFVTLRGSAMPIADGQLADAGEAGAARPEPAITP